MLNFQGAMSLLPRSDTKLELYVSIGIGANLSSTRHIVVAFHFNSIVKPQLAFHGSLSSRRNMAKSTAAQTDQVEAQICLKVFRAHFVWSMFAYLETGS